MVHVRVLVPFAVLAVLPLATGCKNEKPATASAPSATAPAATAPAKPAEAAAKPAPMQAAAEPVDVCSLITREEASKALGGEASEPQADKPQGSLLGGCSYTATGKGMKFLNVSARPAGEWDGTVKAYEELQPVSGIGEAAQYSAKLGMLVKPAGKSYFLHVMAMPGNDKAVVEAAAKSAL